MSLPRHLPERPSLEQLRKQAKEHLETLRATDPTANLAAAQHALAREYGFRVSHGDGNVDSVLAEAPANERVESTR